MISVVARGGGGRELLRRRPFGGGDGSYLGDGVWNIVKGVQGFMNRWMLVPRSRFL